MKSLWDKKIGHIYSLAVLFYFGAGEIGIEIRPFLFIIKDAPEKARQPDLLIETKKQLLDNIPPQYAAILRVMEGGKWAISNYKSGTYLFKPGGALNEQKYERVYFNLLRKLWPFLVENQQVYGIDYPQNFNGKNVRELHIGGDVLTPGFHVYKKENKIQIEMQFRVKGRYLPFECTSAGNGFLLKIENKYQLVSSEQHISLVKEFQNGPLSFPLSDKWKVYAEKIAPLEKEYEINIDEDLGLKPVVVQPSPYILVAEYLNNYLMMIPHFNYEGVTIAYGDKQEVVFADSEKGYLVKRDRTFEKEFFESLRPLHPNFKNQLQHPFFYVPFGDVMKKNWFLKTIRKLDAGDVMVKGLSDLKKFNYNTGQPKFKFGVSSGTDWFNLKIKFSFDDQEVPLQDVRTALMSGQKTVVLADGSFGVLPDEWLKQFEPVLKMGEVEGGKVKLSKKYFTLLAEMEDMVSEPKVKKELDEKKRALIDQDGWKWVPVSEKIKASLREYQQQGVRWMQSLEHFKWGGCLADDMGLGKTLQTITFLQFLKEKYGGGCNLVICPTSLIYNWESEIKKFAPELRYFIYHGSGRKLPDDLPAQYDIVMTSYGTMRNDVAELRNFTFRYIVLDESQAIKNPDALTTRACMLLKSENRLILSGTPIQNNTFDLYAQINFLNPGLLGSMNSFRKTYAIPIDRNHDEEATAELKRLTRPFILRRTKEKVAKDLPDKVEMIYWCVMKEEQRKVYEAFKRFYRKELMDEIDAKGSVGKAAFKVLEGLTRLRQICDSPLLVRDSRFTTTESIKITELLREVVENTGDHKVLVFSQFTEMLKLIREKCSEEGIQYCYLDGGTKMEDRQSQVDLFQNDLSVKLFLISLKAGGVGLNLTAADYVYLIDPWWNPAVEKQAIDRTHRIGQEKKVFAYRMICKDSIEEKILELQEKKKAVSEDIIGEGTSFINKLSKDDIEYLFG